MHGAALCLQKGARSLKRCEEREKQRARVLADLQSAVWLYESQAKVA